MKCKKPPVSSFGVFIIWYAMISVIAFPGNAYAYLDPGSGSALFTGIIAIVTAGFYSIKMLYYKIIGKNISSLKTDENTLVIFSEGKSYWGTFKPIVHELINKKVYFRYITIDVFDPALEIESEYMYSKLYSKSNTGFAKISTLKTPLMLSTTPNIGSEGYPLPRPKNVKELVHVFHSMTDSSNYRLGSLDFYDTVLLMSDHQKLYLQHVEVERHLIPKKMISQGLPYLDNLHNELNAYKRNNRVEKQEKKTILVAPSWGSKGCLNYFGTDFIGTLVKNDFSVIIRLHPHSFINEPKKVQQWQDELKNIESFKWDEELYSTQSMLEADILISDTSSVRFDFAFLHLKPVVTLSIPQEARDEFESVYHETTWDVEIAPSLGRVVEEKDMDKIDTIVTEVLNDFNASDLERLRDENIANFGHSAEHIVAFMEERLKSIPNNIKE